MSKNLFQLKTFLKLSVPLNEARQIYFHTLYSNNKLKPTQRCARTFKVTTLSQPEKIHFSAACFLIR